MFYRKFYLQQNCKYKTEYLHILNVLQYQLNRSIPEENRSVPDKNRTFIPFSVPFPDQRVPFSHIKSPVPQTVCSCMVIQYPRVNPSLSVNMAHGQHESRISLIIQHYFKVMQGWTVLQLKSIKNYRHKFTFTKTVTKIVSTH